MNKFYGSDYWLAPSSTDCHYIFSSVKGGPFPICLPAPFPPPSTGFQLQFPCSSANSNPYLSIIIISARWITRPGANFNS